MAYEERALRTAIEIGGWSVASCGAAVLLLALVAELTAPAPTTRPDGGDRRSDPPHGDASRRRGAPHDHLLHRSTGGRARGARRRSHRAWLDEGARPAPATADDPGDPARRRRNPMVGHATGSSDAPRSTTTTTTTTTAAGPHRSSRGSPSTTTATSPTTTPAPTRTATRPAAPTSAAAAVAGPAPAPVLRGPTSTARARVVDAATVERARHRPDRDAHPGPRDLHRRARRLPLVDRRPLPGRRGDRTRRRSRLARDLRREPRRDRRGPDLIHPGLVLTLPLLDPTP